MTDDEEIGTSTSQLKEQFREMHDIMKELKAGNTDAAIK
jgi:hypothetical protein